MNQPEESCQTKLVLSERRKPQKWQPLYCIFKKHLAFESNRKQFSGHWPQSRLWVSGKVSAAESETRTKSSQTSHPIKVVEI